MYVIFRPYANRWSKTMIGYGSEHTHYIMELIYNYTVPSYELGFEELWYFLKIIFLTY